EIDDKLEFGCLLDRQITRLFALENAIDIQRSAPVELDIVNAVGCKSTGHRVVTPGINVRQAVPRCQRNNEVAVHCHEGGREWDQAALWLARKFLDGTFDFGSIANDRDRYVHPK